MVVGVFSVYLSAWYFRKWAPISEGIDCANRLLQQILMLSKKKMGHVGDSFSLFVMEGSEKRGLLRVLVNPVEIDGHLFSKRITLAGKDETLRHFIVFERVMGVHLNFTGPQVSAAARADSPLASVPKIASVAQTGAEHRSRASL